jgi:hypothetical protein
MYVYRCGCGRDRDVFGGARGCGVVGVCRNLVSFSDSGSRSTSNCLSGGYSGISGHLWRDRVVTHVDYRIFFGVVGRCDVRCDRACGLALASVLGTLSGCADVPPCLCCCACSAFLSTGGKEGMPVIAACLQESVQWREGDQLPRASACSHELAACFPLFSFVPDQFASGCQIVWV